MILDCMLVSLNCPFFLKENMMTSWIAWSLLHKVHNVRTTLTMNLLTVCVSCKGCRIMSKQVVYIYIYIFFFNLVRQPPSGP